MRRYISTDTPFETLAAYSRAVVDGDWLIISGTVGIDPDTGKMPDSAGAQTRVIFRIIEDVLSQAEMTLEDVLHARVFVTDLDYLDEVVAVLAEKFAKVRPANTTVISALPAPGARVEIEATAKRRGQETAGDATARR